MIERIQSFTSKVEAYLIAFVLTLGLLMLASVQTANADDIPAGDDPGYTDSWDTPREDIPVECTDSDGDMECDTLPEE